MPDFSLETTHAGPVCGVDEVGRGPLAGPVVAAAVILDPSRIPDGLDDSKRLTATRREVLASVLAGCATISIGQADVAEIDRLNILHATLLAMRRAVAGLEPAPATALIDGNRAPDLACTAVPVVKGDQRSVSIAAASIVAKVFRDRLMTDLSARHPGYGWDRNAGYGTAEHRAALLEIGPTVHHRRSFAPVRISAARHGLS